MLPYSINVQKLHGGHGMMKIYVEVATDIHAQPCSAATNTLSNVSCMEYLGNTSFFSGHISSSSPSTGGGGVGRIGEGRSPWQSFFTQAVKHETGGKWRGMCWNCEEKQHALNVCVYVCACMCLKQYPKKAYLSINVTINRFDLKSTVSSNMHIIKTSNNFYNQQKMKLCKSTCTHWRCVSALSVSLFVPLSLSHTHTHHRKLWLKTDCGYLNHEVNGYTQIYKFCAQFLK